MNERCLTKCLKEITSPKGSFQLLLSFWFFFFFLVSISGILWASVLGGHKERERDRDEDSRQGLLSDNWMRIDRSGSLEEGRGKEMSAVQLFFIKEFSAREP